MNVERLKRLANLLRKDAADPKGVKFDLSSWADPSEGGGAWPVASQDDPLAIPVSCGTTACALGLAAISGEFKDDGLTYGFLVRQPGEGVLVPKFGGEEGFYAGAALFNIDYDDSRYLFDPDCYSQLPKGAEGEVFVAQRIEAMIAGDIDGDYHPD